MQNHDMTQPANVSPKRRLSMLAAPLQGVTDGVWRTAHAAVFGGIDAYYAPMLRVERGEMRRREMRDVSPQRNVGITLVPQVLACAPADALLMVTSLKQMGYSRVDINLGCPFPPLALHRKGSGMLAHPAEVAALFQALASVDGVQYSVKMRLGWDSADQWRDILPLMSLLHPVHITLHPRIGKQQYRGELDMEQADRFVADCPCQVVFNGCLMSGDDIDAIANRYPDLAGVMLGRGLAAHPGMVSGDASVDSYRRFHDMLVAGYTAQLDGGEGQLVRRLQTIWEYLLLDDVPHRQLKAIRKARTLDQYLNAVTDALEAALA